MAFLLLSLLHPREKIMEKPGEKSIQDQTKDTGTRERALKEREDALERDLKSLNIMRKQLQNFEATDTASGPTLGLPEIGKGLGIELVTDFKGPGDMEIFMDEIVMIYVYPDGQQGSLEVICPTVNGINQPIIRGFEQRVKRKYVEALARSRITNYRQEVADPSRPESIQMKPISALTYPFVVREDRNPKGRAWLEAILAQPM